MHLNSTCNTPTDKQNFKVAVRVRPAASSALSAREEKCIQILSKKSLYFDDGINKNKPKKYMYDYIFGEDSTQDEVYHTTTSPLIKDVLKGLSAAVFAYGSTGSGKTHTMLGPNPKKAATPSSELPPKTSSSAGNGLMVKAIDEIFQHVDESENPSAYKVMPFVSLFNITMRSSKNGTNIGRMDVLVSFRCYQLSE